MFGFGRRPAKTRTELFRDELGETFGHLKQAASHGADSVSTVVRPRMSAAKTAAVGTAAGAVTRMVAARRQGMQQAGEMAGKVKLPMRGRKKARQMARKRRAYRRLTGLLAAGAAVGAVGALIGRRRRKTTWEEYDATTRPPQKPVEMSGSTPAARPSAAQSSTAQPSTAQPSAAQPSAAQPQPGQGTHGVGPLAEQARTALHGPDSSTSDADPTVPITRPASNRRP